MTKGLLIYDREGAKRNKVFIDMLIDRFGKRGIELCLVIFEEMCFGIDSEKPFVSLKDADIKISALPLQMHKSPAVTPS